MPEEQENSEENFEIISWDVPEYEKHNRSKTWYFLFTVIALTMLIYAIFSANFLFAIILVVGSFVLILNDARHPQNVEIAITTEGIIIGRKFYDYDELRSFAIVYKPHDGVKQLYFNFKSKTKHHLSLPLEDTNPLLLRDNLLKYIAEDFDRTDQSTTEALAKALKL